MKLPKLRLNKAEISLAIGQFVLKKHHNLFMRLLAKLICWMNLNRYGKDALGFLVTEKTHDDHF